MPHIDNLEVGFTLHLNTEAIRKEAAIRGRGEFVESTLAYIRRLLEAVIND